MLVSPSESCCFCRSSAGSPESYGDYSFSIEIGSIERQEDQQIIDFNGAAVVTVRVIGEASFKFNLSKCEVENCTCCENERNQKEGSVKRHANEFVKQVTRQKGRNSRSTPIRTASESTGDYPSQGFHGASSFNSNEIAAGNEPCAIQSDIIKGIALIRSMIHRWHSFHSSEIENANHSVGCF